MYPDRRSNLPSVRKNLLLNPPPPPPAPLPLFFLSHYKITLFHCPLVIFNERMNISRDEGPTYPDGHSKYGKKIRTKHSINISASHTNGMYVYNPAVRKHSSGRPLHKRAHIRRCRHTICIFMNCCAVFTQAAWGIGTLRASPKESAIL